MIKIGCFAFYYVSLYYGFREIQVIALDVVKLDFVKLLVRYYCGAADEIHESIRATYF
jgi:hypothetical protein